MSKHLEKSRTSRRSLGVRATSPLPTGAIASLSIDQDYRLERKPIAQYQHFEWQRPDSRASRLHSSSSKGWGPGCCAYISQPLHASQPTSTTPRPQALLFTAPPVHLAPSTASLPLEKEQRSNQCHSQTENFHLPSLEAGRESVLPSIAAERGVDGRRAPLNLKWPSEGSSTHLQDCNNSPAVIERHSFSSQAPGLASGHLINWPQIELSSGHFQHPSRQRQRNVVPRSIQQSDLKPSPCSSSLVTVPPFHLL